MKERKKIVFIVNPKSGTGPINNFQKLINKHLDLTVFDYTILYTERAGHAIEISLNAVQNECYAVIAVGGDGSVNEVSQSLIHTKTILGIIPKGSGNGLARHLKIPLTISQAITSLNKLKKTKLDAIQINNQYSFNVAGVGFDGYISHLFAKSNKRGLATYIKLCIKSYFSYQPKDYHLTIDGKNYDYKAFMISIANSSQFGNNILIAPNAKTNDGLIDICVIKPVNKHNLRSLIYYLLTKKIHKSPIVEMHTCKSFTISSTESFESHIDGEAVSLGKLVTGRVIENALEVLI